MLTTNLHKKFKCHKSCHMFQNLKSVSQCSEWQGHLLNCPQTLSGQLIKNHLQKYIFLAELDHSKKIITLPILPPRSPPDQPWHSTFHKHLNSSPAPSLVVISVSKLQLLKAERQSLQRKGGCLENLPTIQIWKPKFWGEDMILQGQLESQDFKVVATVVQRPETQIVVVLYWTLGDISIVSSWSWKKFMSEFCRTVHSKPSQGW